MAKASKTKTEVAPGRANAAQPAARPRKLKVMVSSSVYHQFNEVHQLCGTLESLGYEVLNSDYGTIYPPLGQSDITLEACLKAVESCDIFLGIITPFYGTSGYTHREFQHAIALNKPRRFICHRYVTFARQLLAPLRFEKKRNGRLVSTGFTIQKTSVFDDVRVIDMYDDAVQSRLPANERRYRWVQEYFYFNEAMRHIHVLFGDRLRVEADYANFNNS
jgi:hypothetical protein